MQHLLMEVVPKMNNKLTVSDLIKLEEIQQWNPGDIIAITAGTGAGKSYFIKNDLYKYAKRNNKKILMLVHRKNCFDQFKQEIDNDNKSDVIDIRTYQYLEALYRNKKTFDFSEYLYICSDEFHYFISDASFNKFSDISLDMILSQQNKIRIFMSATGNYMERYIVKRRGFEIKEYKLDITFDFIKELIFFNKDDFFEFCIEEAIKNNLKTIFFIQSAEKAYDLYKKCKKYAIFNCSKSNKLYKHVDKGKINTMLKEEKFNDLILITTSCMDAGVNIKDNDLKQIVCDLDDTGTLIQAIGRKRLQLKDDYINLFVKTIHNKRLGGMIRNLKKKIEMAQFFKNHTVREYITKYDREYDSHHMVYDVMIPNEKDKGTKKLNELMYFKCLLNIAELQAMLHYKKYGYCKYLAEKLGRYNEEQNSFDYIIYGEKDLKMELEQYLESIIGNRLMKDEQKDLIEKIQLKDARGRLQKSISLFNAYFQENKMPYMIVSKTTSEILDGKRKSLRYWEVIDEIDVK